ncbi:hypothetical protein [Streptomyces sp. NPDC002553]|uniref:hypothetical protein n=1 Tax=Streptomyces sp. NPDC002553 TaxID=3154417 RepID=UPI00331D59F5
MPSFDSSRGRFRLSDDHLAVIGCLTDGDQVRPDLLTAADELRASRLINSNGAVSPLLAPLVKTLSEPTVIVRVESLSEQGLMHHGAVVGKHHVFCHEAWPGDAESEYVQIEPRTLVWALSRMVNLQAVSAAPEDVTSFKSDMGVLDDGLKSLEMISGLPPMEALQHVADSLGTSGRITEPELSTLAALIVELRSSWRMTAAWHGESKGSIGTQVRGFAMWDCGPLGYWHRESPAEPILPGQVSDETPLQLTAASPREVWQMIAEVLPKKGEFSQEE